MIGRADIEGSKSHVAMNAWRPQASYPCGNFSDTSCLKLLKAKRIVRPGISRPDAYWTSRSSQLLSLYSTCGFCPHWADLWTPPLLFWRCTAPVKLPTWQCLRHGVYRSLWCHNIINHRQSGIIIATKHPCEHLVEWTTPQCVRQILTRDDYPYVEQEYVHTIRGTTEAALKIAYLFHLIE